MLQFGTEVVTAADGSIAGLVGASPGGIHPTIGTSLNGSKVKAKRAMAPTAKTLGFSA